MTDVIRRRVSVRTYVPQPLSAELRASVEQALGDHCRGPLGGSCRFALIDLDSVDQRELGRLGTCGLIRGARLFLAGIVAPGPRAFTDFGWCFERVVLELTALGLGTCWMAATFNRAGFAARAGLGAGEEMPVISPLGLPAARRSVVERLAKAVARSRTRKAWDELFFESDAGSPLPQPRAGRFAEALECVRLAPSAVNSQPWRVVKEPDRPAFHFCAAPSVTPDSAGLHTGIAMCHFELAAREAGLGGSWRVLSPAPALGRLSYQVTWS